MTTTTLTAVATTAIVLPVTDEPNGINDAEGVEDPESDARVVRFDSECVLIPDLNRSKRPKVLTKSYSLPLWKRRPHHQLSDADALVDSDLATSPTASVGPLDTHVVIKVPIPFISKASRSPSRGRTASSSPQFKPLSPCLVHRSPSAASASRSRTAFSPVRCPSLPVYHRPRDDSELTIPLRACCPNCEVIAEECLKDDHWQEKFTRGARRRRSASLDNGSSLSSASIGTKGASTSGFAAIAGSNAKSIGGPVVISGSRNPASPSAFAITVDEVDKRRRSQEWSEDEIRRLRSSPTLASPFNAIAPPLRLPRPRDREFSPGSMSSGSDELSSEHDATRILRSSPIPEEDEAQLFPLPSPCRSPNVSPSTSPRTSPRPTPKPSPIPSPNTSTACLNTDESASSSNENTSFAWLSGLSGGDGKLQGSLSRKMSDPFLSLPINSHTSGNITSTETAAISDSPLPIPATAPINIPSPSPQPRSPKHTNLSLSLHFPSRYHNHSASTPPVIPSPPSFSSPISDAPSSPTLTRNSGSPVLTRKPSSPKMRKLSFSQPFMKAGEALKVVGADMLKGVSSMGGGGSVVGSA